jgi:hypothetical protein
VAASILVPSATSAPSWSSARARADFVDMKYLSPERVEMHYACRWPRSSRLLRPAQDAHARLRVTRLRRPRLPRERPRQARHPGRRRPHRRAVAHRAPGARLPARPALVEKLQPEDPAPALRGPDPGRDRQQGHRPRDHQGLPQGRARQVLRRRHHPQAQAAREAERRQEADEEPRRRRGAAGGLRAPSPGGCCIRSGEVSPCRARIVGPAARRPCPDDAGPRPIPIPLPIPFPNDRQPAISDQQAAISNQRQRSATSNQGQQAATATGCGR